MKVILSVLIAVLGLTVAGCGGRNYKKESNPDLGTGNVERKEMGQLIVHTDPLGTSSTAGRGRDYYKDQVPYSIYDERGKLIRHEMLSADVSLPPGKYQIRLKGDDKSDAKWVTVEAGKTSEIDIREFSVR